MITIDQVIASKIGSWYIAEWPLGNAILCVIALIITSILCGLIGFERERRGKTAGLRTHLLVGLGSCIIMIISIYGFPTIVIGDVTLNRDVARLAAQVVTGVGFLGAGAIIHRNDGIKGLTTAATIWICMAIGLACGSFNFILATVSSLLIFVCLVLFKVLEKRYAKLAPLIMVKCEVGHPIISNIMDIASKASCEVKDFSSEIVEDKLELVFIAKSKNQSFSSVGFIAELEKIDGVIYASLIENHK